MIAIRLDLLFDFYVGMRNGACYRVKDLLIENGCEIPEISPPYAELQEKIGELEAKLEKLKPTPAEPVIMDWDNDYIPED